ncbi:MAG: hypothetical protein N2248_07110 [candidate division WOR-3 bacterium]|nr:hypothetical protein [candidate division WOR-3 bacterium]
MCCRACAGYEICRTRGRVKDDDCCPQCQYFDSCMEEPDPGDSRQRRPANRRPAK